ncbi:MAG: lipopolysaccharide heptosyltransferase II [Acidobacteria bacterium]|nr:lipopolysaccharide heptosyltransferase II [Acidobacteriota bacterium]
MPDNFLIRATNWVGDAVMSLPALHALRRAHPQAKMTILARPWVADLYGREPFCDELIPWHGYQLKAIAELFSRRFDCAVLLQNAFGAALTVSLAMIPQRIGYDRDARGFLLNDAIQVPQPGEIPPHESFYYLELLRRAGLIDEPLPTVASIRLSGVQPNPHAQIGVSPGAAYGGAKRWLPERFAESALQLARQLNTKVMVFGTAGERDVCEQVAYMIRAEGIEAHNTAGQTTLRQFIDEVARCRVMITNDSGSMHIASAVGVPTVAVFGATNHITTGPTGTHARVVRHDVECSPCLQRECHIDHRCMTRVSSDLVAATALELLK